MHIPSIGLMLLMTALHASGQSRPVLIERVSPLSETFSPLRLSEITPAGWIARQIGENLAGSVGNLDRLVPALIRQDDIFGKDRLSRSVRSKEVGAVLEPGDWQIQTLWWNSETQGNWLDGFCRSAVLCGDTDGISRAEAMIRSYLSTQDTDGYIGIYDRDLRYTSGAENGELWSKTVLYRALLGWYEFRQDPKILEAVIRAVENVMKNYPAGSSHPFFMQKPMAGGVTHGLMFTDVLESLCRITGDGRYRDYALFLYRDFSENQPEEDAALAQAVDPARLLRGHGVHTYEHLRAMAAAWYATGAPLMRDAVAAYLAKIDTSTTPAGGPIGDEFIGGRCADAAGTGYEYCSLQELMHGYADLLLKTGSAVYGDKAERIFFNAAQGARYPGSSLIAYLKSDNSYAMNGYLNGDSASPIQRRYKYSAAHQDAAVCCVPNAGRIAPCFVQHMWMRSPRGLVASLLGPCTVETKVDARPVRIVETTLYPYQTGITFTVENPSGAEFELLIRRPSWATSVISDPEPLSRGEYLEYHPGRGRTTIGITFGAEVEIRRFHHERYFTLGPLVYARPIPCRERLDDRYPLPGFEDRYCLPVDGTPFTAPPGVAGTAVWDELHGWFRITAELVNAGTATPEKVVLQPVGSTVLRQVTFR